MQRERHSLQSLSDSIHARASGYIMAPSMCGDNPALQAHVIPSLKSQCHDWQVSHCYVAMDRSRPTALGEGLGRDFSAGMVQLFTPYHHRRTLAPIEFPLSCALRFQCCQPSRARLYTTPWARGIMTFVDAVSLHASSCVRNSQNAPDPAG
jgi:hypothetical protein